MNPMDNNPQPPSQPEPDLWGTGAPAVAAATAATSTAAAAQTPGWERSVLERLAFDML